LADALLRNRRLQEGSKSSNFTINNPFKPLTMKYKILLVVFLAALISGCSTAYQAGQTPDDVYYSPAKQAVARVEKKEERRTERYEQYMSSEDDNYLRRKIQNRSRWSSIDDFDYWYDPSYSTYYSYRTFGYNPYLYNNWYGYNRPVWDRYYFHDWYGAYSPNYNRSSYGGGYYGQPVYVIKNPLQAAPSTDVSRPSLGGYSNKSYSNGNRTSFGDMLKRAVTTPSGNTAYSNSNSNSGYSNNSSSSRTYEPPSRSYDPPASSGNSSGSSPSSGSSNSGGVTRPPR
jgi:hypothetical protein